MEFWDEVASCTKGPRALSSQTRGGAPEFKGSQMMLVPHLPPLP